SCNGKSLFFTGDHEWPSNIYEPDDEDYDEFQDEIQKRYAETIDFIRDVDALIIDTSYTREEFPSKIGWGHGSFDTSIQVARDARVKQCFLTHHEPTRSDEALEAAFEKAMKDNAVSEEPTEPVFRLSREGLTTVL
ncbi:MAG: hypothetical protein MRY76_15275, partial [Pseudomonadales bacterium]|nr:hypothetical protein [Pseudomonadales bacterium]